MNHVGFNNCQQGDKGWDSMSESWQEHKFSAVQLHCLFVHVLSRCACLHFSVCVWHNLFVCLLGG